MRKKLCPISILGEGSALPFLGFDPSDDRDELSLIDGTSLTGFALLKRLTNAKDDLQPRVKSSANFLGNKFRSLDKDGAALRVPCRGNLLSLSRRHKSEEYMYTKDDPWNTGINQLLRTTIVDLAKLTLRNTAVK